MKAKIILCAALLAVLGACSTVTTANGENDRINEANGPDVATAKSESPATPIAEVEMKISATMKRAKVLEFLQTRLGAKSPVVAAYLEPDGAGALAKLCNKESLRTEAMLALTLSAWVGDEAARARLDGYLESSQQECGMMAILGAAFLEQRREIPLLIKRLGSESPGGYFCGLTGVVLARMTAWDLPTDAAAWTKWWGGHEKTYVERYRIDWDLLIYEVENNPLSGDWQFDVGAETNFIEALKCADLKLRGVGATPGDLRRMLVMMRIEDEYAVGKALGDLIAREEGNAYYRYLMAAAKMKRGDYAGCENAYTAIGNLNAGLAWSRVLAAYSKKVAAVKDIGEEECVKILVGEIDKIGRIDFDTDVPAKYLATQMMAVDPYEVEILARDSDDEAVVAGALLMMPPENLVRLGMGTLKAKIAKNRIALYAMMQAIDQLEMGMAGGQPGDLAGEFREAIGALEALDPDNGVFAAIRAGMSISHAGPGIDANNRPTAAKAEHLAALEAALAKSKFTLYEEETIAAIRAALVKLGHPMPAARTLQAFRETGSCYTTISNTAERLQTNIIDAIIAGDEAGAARAQAIVEKLAEKIASRHKSVDNMQLAISLRRHAYNGRALGLREAGKNDEADAVMAERNKAEAEAQALLFARLDQRPRPPVPVLADMLAEAVLRDEIEFLKKYSLSEKP